MSEKLRYHSDTSGSSMQSGAVDASRRRALEKMHQRYQAVLQKTGQKDTGVREWFEKTIWVDDASNQNSINSREEFFRGHGLTIITEGQSLHDKFFAEMKRAEKYISKDSYQRWVKERFMDQNVSFLGKKYWIEHQMKPFVESWIKVATERDKLAADPAFNDLIAFNGKLSILANRENFLNLHFETRRGLVDEAKALINADKKLQVNLYTNAQTRLENAASNKYIADHKVGTWLHRIFKSNANSKKIETFVNGSGANTLSGLIENWKDVKKRFDLVKGKIDKCTEATMPRGLHPVSEHQFLSMHYTQRLRYVEETERRLNDSPDPNQEKPIFLEIRHAMDNKDWPEAQILIAKAEKEDLTPDNLRRLQSMKQYTTQFAGSKESSLLRDAEQAKQRIDTIIDELQAHHPQMRETVERLLKGPNANRSIHQLRWIAYNNIWCRTHGPPYLNDDVARNGASEDNKAMTKYRAEQGLDVGRHDVIDRETADKEYFRKKEFSKHKATYLHTNVASGGAKSALAEWLEREQDAKTLYWTTLQCHEEGDPKDFNWHNEFFMQLTDLRSCTRTLHNAGFAYGGKGQKLKSIKH